MKKIVMLALMFFICLLSIPIPYGHCESLNNWGGTDRTLLLGRELPYDLVYMGVGRGGVSSIVSTVTPLTATHLAFSLLRFTDGSPGDRELPDGVKGKSITLEMAGSPSITIADDTPNAMTKTGWTRIALDNQGDSITLLWVDDTYGWIITANDGCAITR